MSRSRWRLRRDEAGVTIVEAAFVLPLLFLFAFALVDVGLWVLQDDQATNAAREGARAGIVLPIASDAAQTANETKIETAVNSRLTDPVSAGDIDVDCDPDDDGPLPYGSCIGVTSNDYGTARLRVNVQWNRPFLTFVGDLIGNTNVQGTSSMVIVGAPE
jgi:hypothetical protein